MSTLDLDLGNQRLKWRLDGECGACGAASLDSRLPQALKGRSVTRIRLSSVGRHEDALLGCLARLCPGVRSELAEVDPQRDGLTCGYSQPHQLGVDRWLALLAARQLRQRACVADLGTAITLDYLDNTVHLGGYIAPGLATMRASLVQNTRDINLDRPDDSMDSAGKPSLPPGSNTEDALRHGTAQALVALMLQAARGMDELDGDWPLVLTGGDAPWVAEALKARSGLEWQLAEHLVLDGLAIALP